MIRVRDLRVSYRGHQVSHVPRLDIRAGEIVGVVGESGSGKSQAALAMIGLNAYSGAEVTGSISFDDMELTDLTNRQWRAIRGRRIAMIMQSPRSALNPTIRLGDLFLRTLRLHGVTRQDARVRIREALGEVLLDEEILTRYPHEVSGGQAQRFAIALVAALRAEVVLADEPTSALDVTVQAEVVEMLRDLRDRHGTGILFISHDLALVGELADSVMVMRGGAVVEAGPTSELLRAPGHPYTRALLDAVPVIKGGGR